MSAEMTIAAGVALILLGIIWYAWKLLAGLAILIFVKWFWRR